MSLLKLMQSFRLQSLGLSSMDIVWNEIIAGREATAEQISDMRWHVPMQLALCKVTRKMQSLAGMTAISPPTIHLAVFCKWP